MEIVKWISNFYFLSKKFRKVHLDQDVIFRCFLNNNLESGIDSVYWTNISLEHINPL